MRNGAFGRLLGAAVALLALALALGVGAVTELSELQGKVFAVPEGTVADQLVLSRFPGATFKYYPNALMACLAVGAGEADAAAYDEPILRNIAAKNPGLAILAERITTDGYGFAAQLNRQDLKEAVDRVVANLKASGEYDAMLARWLPAQGEPGDMPEIALENKNGVLRFGTAAVTEPFSFLDKNGNVVGFDVELAVRVARELGMALEVMNMDFGEMFPALTEGKVDLIGACVTITPERAAQALFSEPYYLGGIAALVKQ